MMMMMMMMKMKMKMMMTVIDEDVDDDDDAEENADDDDYDGDIRYVKKSSSAHACLVFWHHQYPWSLNELITIFVEPPSPIPSRFAKMLWSLDITGPSKVHPKYGLFFEFHYLNHLVNFGGSGDYGNEWPFHGNEWHFHGNECPYHALTTH